MGALATHVDEYRRIRSPPWPEARSADRSSVIVIDTDPLAISTEAGGHWWDVAIPEVSDRAEVAAARASYEPALRKRP